MLLAEASGGKKLIFAVRLAPSEARLEEAKKFSLFECGGERYMLVEGIQRQVRTSCPREIRGLDVPAYQVFAAGKETLEQSPDLVYATASEEPEVGAAPARSSQRRAKVKESSSKESEEEEDEASEDDLFRMLRKAGKTGAAKDMISKKDPKIPKSSRSRCPLLDKKNKSRKDAASSSTGAEALLQQSLASGRRM